MGFATPAAAVKTLGVSMGAHTWVDIETPGRPRKLTTDEADEIADAARMPRSYFTAPLERLGDVAGGS